MRLAALAVAVAALLAPQQSPPPNVDTAGLLAMASRWTVRFEQGLSGLLFREIYRQSATTELPNMGFQTDRFSSGAPRMEGNRGQLLLEANMFLIKPSESSRFVVYRDTYVMSGNVPRGQVDLTDHTDRLEALLVENTASSLEQARKLTDASARLNMGEVSRNVNVPTMAFEYLKPEHIGGIRARPVAREAVNGLDAVVIEFQEMARPTVVRGHQDSDVPAAGRYWINPGSGAVMRAFVEFPTGRYTGRIEVQLALHELLKVWVPAEMKEVWHAGARRVNGLASYDKFQRLAVTTTEIAK